jgi:hypothetical protein
MQDLVNNGILFSLKSLKFVRSVSVSNGVKAGAFSGVENLLKGG